MVVSYAIERRICLQGGNDDALCAFVRIVGFGGRNHSGLSEASFEDDGVLPPSVKRSSKAGPVVEEDLGRGKEAVEERVVPSAGEGLQMLQLASSSKGRDFGGFWRQRREFGRWCKGVQGEAGKELIPPGMVRRELGGSQSLIQGSRTLGRGHFARDYRDPPRCWSSNKLGHRSFD
ncbi:hypothetical protein QJS10_CPA09g01098 [Acorus calamus]|uniref:Uncharacterized protein n=1 Tax=Acorus calamus TaxID=4465 RepID=A0AAV9E6Q4_ACOCL|nr:hypothetical protein QJS10_CPA09g01098 [Acorus calamus]